jgi:hypothetical protein
MDTLPTLDRKYPEGLGGIGQLQDDIARLLAYPLVIFSGDRDIDTGSENLPRTTRRWRRDRTASSWPARPARTTHRRGSRVETKPCPDFGNSFPHRQYGIRSFLDLGGYSDAPPSIATSAPVI